MKKYFLAIGLVAFLMTSCCDKQENNENKECCKDKKEQCDKHQHECDHHGEKPGMCPEMMGCMDRMIEALANWEDLDEDQRAELIDMAKKMQEMKANMPKHECKGEGEGHKCEGNHEGCNHQHEGCNHEEGHKCEGNHEGCQGNHEGCQHQHENCEHHQDK